MKVLRFVLGLISAVILILGPLPGWSDRSTASGAAPIDLSSGRSIVGASATSGRRVIVRPASGSVAASWGTASLFWFGQATPSNNYVDVRIAYDSQALYVWATVVDYYLWYDPNGTTDPRTYDAFAIYLDTGGDKASSPQADDVFFVSGFRFYPPGSDPRWQRQGRGNNGVWDETWLPSPAWTDSTGSRFYTSGPNNNSDLDAGWTTTLTIPWATLGLTGPPPSGTTWGIGAALDDRDDQPPAGAVPPEVWPETFVASSPATWATLAFDPPAYQPAPAVVRGTTQIRRGLNGTVADAYVGGGGSCSGGIYGGGDTAHPTDDLFVQNEADVSDFPCFSRSYLQFDLSAIPPGKVIISATLQLHEFGSSSPDQAQPSFLQFFAVSDAWSESALTWNNAPLAAENLTGTWVDPTVFPGWPGLPVTWDATQLVAEAYSAGQAANLALYSADTNYHSGRYFTSSEAGDWDAVGRPTLTVVWGDPTLALTAAVAPTVASQGSALTYSFVVAGNGRSLQLVAPVPSSLSYVAGSATGGATYDPTSRSIRWSGAPGAGQTVALGFQASVATASGALVTTTATVSDDLGNVASASTKAIVNGVEVTLPIMK